MNNPLQVTFSDNTKAVYHITIGCSIKQAIAELEQETGKTIVSFKWLFN